MKTHALLLVVAIASRSAAASEPDGLHCAGPEPAFVTDSRVVSAPPLAEPAPREPFRDPVFGRCLIRVTDRRHDLSPDDRSSGITNEYARVQSFNSDQTRLLARGTEGTWYLYDAHSLRPLRQLPLEVEPRWDPTDPDHVLFVDGTRLMACSASRCRPEPVHDFAPDLPGLKLGAVWSRYEGRPSRDGRYWGFLAQDPEWNPVAFLVYDRARDRLVARRMLQDMPAAMEGIDHVTMSPLGTYFLASFDRYCEPGRLGSDEAPCGLMVYDRGLGHGRGLLRIIGHYDTALDASGREVVVFQDLDQDSISLLDLASGRVTALQPIDFSSTAIGLHFSGCAFDVPGWALVSTHDADAQSHTRLDDQVLAVELVPSGRIVRLAHTRSVSIEGTEEGYWAEPRATVSRDFTRVLFTSNWGHASSAGVEMYLIKLPRGWTKRLPRAP